MNSFTLSFIHRALAVVAAIILVGVLLKPAHFSSGEVLAMFSVVALIVMFSGNLRSLIGVLKRVEEPQKLSHVVKLNDVTIGMLDDADLAQFQWAASTSPAAWKAALLGSFSMWAGRLCKALLVAIAAAPSVVIMFSSITFYFHGEKFVTDVSQLVAKPTADMLSVVFAMFYTSIFVVFLLTIISMWLRGSRASVRHEDGVVVNPELHRLIRQQFSQASLGKMRVLPMPVHQDNN
ncbi:hypothetical protein [Aeromonas hydrophila]|uniref:hypothetical protein n=1 Tax=Aeromonas hydrophila TaxID=644 RepID=UPI002256561E|nr:hypothetical protein [Aeromonas hydrophila]MCX4116327.1 hypothetical protein [Aeromonas hydrophila]